MWALADAFDYSAITLALHVAAAQFAYLGSLTPVLFLLFALRYSGRARGPVRWRFAWLFVVPMISIVAAFTNQSHHLLWPGFTVLAGRPNMLVYQHGPVYWLVTVYSLGVALLATLVLVDTAMRARGVHRTQSTVMAVASLIPWVGGVIYSRAPAKLGALDPSLTFTVAAAIFAWTMWRLKLLDLAPVPREVLVEEMTDGLIVLDCDARILEINPAAVRLLGLTNTPDLGTPATDAFSAWSQSGKEAVAAVYEQRVSTLASPSVAFRSVERSRLEGGSECHACDLFILRDISAQIEAERARDAAYKDLQGRLRLAETMASVGDGRVSATVSLGVATFPEHGTTIDEIIAAADQAAYASKKAGTIG